MSDDSPNPFADFLFQPATVPGKRPHAEGAFRPAIVGKQRRVSTISSSTVASASPPTEPTALGLPTSAWAANDTASSPAYATAKLQRLAELELVTAFREVTRASVDDFHAFLISLGTGGETDLGSPVHGRFWALVACLLSVQCRDSVALSATRALLRRCAGGGAASVAALTDAELDDCIRSCNFCNTKAKNVRAAAAHAVRHGGRVPEEYDALLKLEGVGPKIAHLLRSVALGRDDAGIVVDTHVQRVATRLGWVDAATALGGAERIRIQLEEWVPADQRVAFSLAVVGFGQHSRKAADFRQAFVEHARRRKAERSSRAESAASEGTLGSAINDDEEAKGDVATTATMGNPPSSTQRAESTDLVALAESIVARMGA